MGSNVNETPKRHILARVRVVWAIKRENPSSRLTCRWVHEKKGINKKKISLYFTHLPRSPPSTDLHQIWRSRRGRRRNHLYQIFWWSVKGCLFCGGSKIAISHWQNQSPLTQGWRYRAARDMGWLRPENGGLTVIKGRQMQGRKMRDEISVQEMQDLKMQDRKMKDHSITHGPSRYIREYLCSVVTDEYI